MSDLFKSPIDPAIFETLKAYPKERGVYKYDLGSPVLGSGGIIFSEDDSTSYRPGFFEMERNRGTMLVDMNDNGEITAAPDEEKRIATFGLGGCTAVAVAIDFADGSRKGYVQHYSALNRLLSADTLGVALNDLQLLTNAVSKRAVIMTPGAWSGYSASYLSAVTQDETLTNLLSAVAERGLGADADIQIYPYSEVQSSDSYGEGTLMVEFRPGSETVILAESMAVKPA